MFSKNLLSDFCSCAWRRSDFCSVCTHNFTSEWLLFVRNFYHINLTVKSEIRACHRKCSTPLTGTGLCCNTFKPLLFCIISLCDSRVKFVASACVIAFKFIVNLSRCLQFFLKTICTDKR